MTKQTTLLSGIGIGLGAAMVVLGLYRMFTTDSPVGDALVKLGILLILFSRCLPKVEGRKRLPACAVTLAAVILVLAGSFCLDSSAPFALGSVLKTGGLILGVAYWIWFRLFQPAA